MIECKNGFTGWWDGREKVDCRFFDKDPNKAYRFATKEEAERVIAVHGNSCQIATEHKWLQAEPAPEPVAWVVYVGYEVMKAFETHKQAEDWARLERLNGSPYTYHIRTEYTHPPKAEPVPKRTPPKSAKEKHHER